MLFIMLDFSLSERWDDYLFFWCMCLESLISYLSFIVRQIVCFSISLLRYTESPLSFLPFWHEISLQLRVTFVSMTLNYFTAEVTIFTIQSLSQIIFNISSELNSTYSRRDSHINAENYFITTPFSLVPSILNELLYPKTLFILLQTRI